MDLLGGNWVISATDLVTFSSCEHLLELEKLVASGLLTRPDRIDPDLSLLASLGEQHEEAQLERLSSKATVHLSAIPSHTHEGLAAAESATVSAMASGVDVIYQPTFFDG